MTNPTTLDTLATALAQFRKDNGLPPEGDALDLLQQERDKLTGTQRKWLSKFAELWDATEERARETSGVQRKFAVLFRLEESREGWVHVDAPSMAEAIECARLRFQVEGTDAFVDESTDDIEAPMIYGVRETGANGEARFHDFDDGTMFGISGMVGAALPGESMEQDDEDEEDEE